MAVTGEGTGDAGGTGRRQQSSLLSRVTACIWISYEIINFLEEIKGSSAHSHCPAPANAHTTWVSLHSQQEKTMLCEGLLTLCVTYSCEALSLLMDPIVAGWRSTLM